MRTILRKLATIALIVLIAGVGGFYGARHLMSQMILSQPKKPYTIQMHHKVYLPDGRVHNQKMVVYARRSDGSFAERHSGTRPDGSSIRFSKLELVPERAKISIHEPSQSTVTEYVPQEAVLFALSKPLDPSCKTQGPGYPDMFEYIGDGEIAGFRVIKRTATKPNGAKAEEWRAPDLDCARLYWRDEAILDNGVLDSIAEETAIAVTAGEPSPELFEVPSDYTERSPAEIFAELAKNQPCESCSIDKNENLRRREQAYHESRKYAPK